MVSQSSLELSSPLPSSGRQERLPVHDVCSERQSSAVYRLQFKAEYAMDTFWKKLIILLDSFDFAQKMCQAALLKPGNKLAMT